MSVGKVVHKAVKWVSCSRCGRGRKLRRTKTFTAVLGPGQHRVVVLAGLMAKAEHWEPVGTHPPCQCPYFTDPLACRS